MNLSENNLTILRKDALRFFNDGVKAVDAYSSINNHFKLNENILTISNINGAEKSFNLNQYKSIYVVGAGKASVKMADAVLSILNRRITDSLIITKYGFSTSTINNQIIEAAHPIPDKEGISAAKRIIKICEKADAEDLIIFLLSGGASALLTLPEENISLKDLQQLNKILLSSGIEISEMNKIRKHISKVKGGKIAAIAEPAAIVTLAISDVLCDDMEIIGSAPTIADSSTFEDAFNILNKSNLINKIPYSIKEFISNRLNEKPKRFSDKNLLAKNTCNYFIIANNQIALNAVKLSAEKLGYNSLIVSNDMKGEAKLVAKNIAAFALGFHKGNDKKICLIYGGETTVKIKGKGKGGRNQELCLAAAIELEGKNNIVLLSCGTDGDDGTTDAAGAICDGQTIDRTKNLKLNAGYYLANNDSYSFFSQLDDLIKIPVAQTNVMDVVIVVAG